MCAELSCVDRGFQPESSRYPIIRRVGIQQQVSAAKKNESHLLKLDGLHPSPANMIINLNGLQRSNVVVNSEDSRLMSRLWYCLRCCCTGYATIKVCVQ